MKKRNRGPRKKREPTGPFEIDGKPVGWKDFKQGAFDFLQAFVAPHIPKIMDAIAKSGLVRCPKCKRPQPEGTVEYALDRLPQIKCECGYSGDGALFGTPDPTKAT